jgi:hypothetical protein
VVSSLECTEKLRIYRTKRVKTIIFHGNEATNRLLIIYIYIFFFKDPIYLQSVIIHSANGGKGEGCIVEEYTVALLC